MLQGLGAQRNGAKPFPRAAISTGGLKGLTRNMIRISTIFIAICMVLVAASLGLVLYSVAGISGLESAIVALTALTFLILYNAVSMRLRDRTDVGGQIADLSRGTADLARQVAEFGRRLTAVEGKLTSLNHAGADRIQAVVGEINELGGLVKHLAVSVASHDDMLAASAAAAAVADERESPAARGSAPLPLSRRNWSWPRRRLSSLIPSRLLPRAAKCRHFAAVKTAIEENRLDIYLQPMVTLPQRKVRFYEAVTRIRDENDRVLAADDFLPFRGGHRPDRSGGSHHDAALCSGAAPPDGPQQGSRRVLQHGGRHARNPATFAPCLDFLEANRALAPSFVIEFKQATFRNLGRRRERTSGGAGAARLPFLDRPCHRPADRTARAGRPRRPLHQGAGRALARSESRRRHPTFTLRTCPICLAASAST